MASIIEKRNKKGELTSYKFMTCVGRDSSYKQIWRTKTIKRPEGLTPAKERKEVERLADAWEQEQKAAYQQGHNKDKDKITFSQFVREHWWTDHVEDGTHTPSSISFYRYMSDDLLAYFGDKQRLNQIDVEAVKRYLKYLNTKAVTKKGQPYSKSTIKHHFNVLRIILEYARRLHYIETDPCQDLNPKEKPQANENKIDFLDSQQVKAYMDALSTEPLFWRCYQNVLITTGLRRGEALGLQWRDIDAKKLTITVSRNVTIDRNSPEKYHVGTTKGKDARVVPISKRVMSLLMERKRQQAADYGTVMPTAYIFNRASDAYKPQYPTEPTRWQRRFVQRHGLPNVSPHDLRHTAASLALEGGADLKQVQTLLGHKDPSTTMKFYAGVSEEQQRRTVESIESLLG